MHPVLDSIDWTRVGTFLEVGCGTGGVLDGAAERMPGALVVRVDATSSMLRRAAREHARVQGDAHRLPLAAANGDAAVCGFVLKHTERPDIVFRELERVVRPGGQLRVTAWGGRLRG